MKRLKQAGLILWTALPLVTMASFKQMEADTIDRVYASKECQYQAYEYREKDYQKRYEEGYDKGFETGVHAAFYRAKAATFDTLMGKLEEMGVFDKNIEEKIKEEMEVALSLNSKSKE